MSFGGDSDLTIRLHLDASAAQAAKAQQISALRELEAEADRVARSMSGATEDSAGRQRDAMGRFVSSNRAAQDDVVRATRDSVGVQASLFEELAGTVDPVVQNLAGMAAQFLAIAAPAAVIGILKGEFDAFHQTVMASTNVLNQYRESVAEVAELRGQIGQSTAVVRQDITSRSQTLQTQQESQQFSAAALGVGQAAIGRQITQADFDRLLQLAGSLQVATRAEAGALGGLAGSIPLLLGRQTTADESFQELERLRRTFQPGGATLSSLANQFQKSAIPVVTSGVIGREDAAALLSAFSLSNREGAGETLQAFLRATVGAVGRGRKVKGLEGEYTEAQGEYLRDLGITDQAGSVEIGQAVTADLRRQREEATRAGRQFNPLQYLQQRGYAEQQARESLLLFGGLAESGQLQTFQDISQRLPTVAEAMAPVEKFQAVDPRAATRRNELAGQAAQLALAAGPAETYRRLAESTFNAQVADRRAAGTFEDWESSWKPWRGMQLRSEVDYRLGQEERRMGLKVGGDRSWLQGVTGFDILQNQTTLGGQWSERLERIREAGGRDPFEQANEETIAAAQQALDVQSKSEEHLANILDVLRGQRAGAPTAAPGRRVAPMPAAAVR